LIERLSSTDDYYYLVPFSKRGPGRTRTQTARILIDAKTGAFQEIGGIEDPTDRLTPFVDPDEAIGQLIARQPSAPFADGSFKPWVRRENVVRQQQLVWQTCAESRSALRPFFVIVVADVTLYLRADGAWFRRLTRLTSGA
jgi:hypothetical protein